MQPRVRIAPSPTGLLHIGTTRTALFNYLFAKRCNGKFILRIEDTDKERSQKEYEENISEGLKALGIQADESPENPGEFGPYRQSERGDLYKPYLEKLLQEEKAFYCFSTPEEVEEERKKASIIKSPFRFKSPYRDITLSQAKEMISQGKKAVIRLKMPENQDISFTDLIKGDMKQNTNDLAGDMVIAKDLDAPLYNFVVVIDDALMKITHVIRGEDHLSNTPKQIVIYQMLGFDIPQFAHLPLILNQDKTKLSKRKNAVSVNDYLEKGYLPEALVNFIAKLGWNDGTEQEVYTQKELEEKFSLERVGKSGAIFDIDQLNWLNKEHIKKYSDIEITSKCLPYLVGENMPLQKIDEEIFLIKETDEEIMLADLASYIKHEKERIKMLSEITESLDFYFKKTLAYEIELLIGKKMTKDDARWAIENLIPFLTEIEDFSEESLKEKLIEQIQQWNKKNGEILWPMRAALTGKERSPGAFEVASCLGKEKTIERLKYAQDNLAQ